MRLVGSDLLGRLLGRCEFPPPGTQIDCAVSGGADSLALLVLATRAGCSVTAWHVDHRLRANTDASVVEDAAARYGARFSPLSIEVGAGPNLEDRARRMRFAALPPGVSTGHTADDQAETVLLALFRGAGIDGLSGMASARHPILGLRRAETVALCAEEGLTPVSDPTNWDPAMTRNRIRHELLPLASDIARRDLVPLLVRTAALARDDASLLASVAASLDPTDARALAAAPVAAARRAIRTWLSDPYPPSAAAVERVLAVARGEVQACEVAGVGRIARHHQRLVLSAFFVPPT